MTNAVVVHTDLIDSVEAGQEFGSRISAAFSGSPPDALIVFASSKYDYGRLLQALEDSCHPKTMVGCSSAGEFTTAAQGEGMACAVAIRSSDMRFSAAVGRGLNLDRSGAAADLVSSFTGMKAHDYRFRSAMVLADALAGYTDELIERLTMLTAGTYQFVGGGAGDDARFQRTHVFYGTEPIADAVVALEILSERPIGIGASHGWEPVSDAMRVTEADGTRVISLNATPAVEIFQEHAGATGQLFDLNDPVPFFLNNVIGIDTGQGFKLRVPLALSPDGSIAFASNVPAGSIVHIMEASSTSTSDAASTAVTSALQQLNGWKPKVALFFDCVATRLRLGKDFGYELDTVRRALGKAQLVGCNTYGQIVRADGQFSGFHNGTAVVCIIPE
ncbi:MAG TPA: FIST N-terminal domain-containing protein [Nitrolancea sp.]|nr:FIST N-terminal domain-containing protein [Nitrolancea sp.]